ncbi:type II secretion system minor pseudopilin GspI [uncultured Shewanella sp.]|uniref:type II secretion system minor pseudopilin GspI n=1 Tax=uncultured Shewanella sp. TaxID=173975 RepID=UPI002627E9BF|nr:type II secretion system minor pseudopilin GspI [uncultured Shewanella sp.]
MRMRRSTLSHMKGMTLLEVIVALAVFSIAAIAITKSLSELISNMPILEERTLAQWVVDNQLVDVKLSTTFPDVGRKDGQTTLAGRDWYWRQQVIKTDDDKFRLVKVSVSDTDNFKRTIAEVSTYVFNDSSDSSGSNDSN